MGLVSYGIDAVNALGMMQSSLVLIDDSTTDYSITLLFDSTTELYRDFFFLSLLFAASVFLLNVSRPFSTFAVQITIVCYFYFFYFFLFHTTIKYIKGTVCLRPQIAKANRGGRSYTQSVVKPVIIKIQQYNNIRLNTKMLN